MPENDDFTLPELRRHLPQAAAGRRQAQENFERWIVRAYGRLPVTEIAQLADLTVPGVYHILDRMGVDRTRRTPRSPLAKRS